MNAPAINGGIRIRISNAVKYKEETKKNEHKRKTLKKGSSFKSYAGTRNCERTMHSKKRNNFRFRRWKTCIHVGHSSRDALKTSTYMLSERIFRLLIDRQQRRICMRNCWVGSFILLEYNYNFHSVMRIFRLWLTWRSNQSWSRDQEWNFNESWIGDRIKWCVQISEGEYNKNKTTQTHHTSLSPAEFQCTLDVFISIENGLFIYLQLDAEPKPNDNLSFSMRAQLINRGALIHDNNT